MKIRTSILTCLCCVAWAASAQDQAKHTITKFDVPGAGTGSGQGTLGIGIVKNGAIMGRYIDSTNVAHGYLRSPTGTITTFDPTGSVNTFPSGMNAAEEMTGYYLDSEGVYHGFQRTPTGTITSFDAPGAGTSSGQGTIAEDINTRGEVAGYYADSYGVLHGFLRSPIGHYTKFDAPGAGVGTVPAGFDALSDNGVVTGIYIDSFGINHGFLRTLHGPFEEFTPGNFSQVTGINTSGYAVGYFSIANNGIPDCYFRTPNGAIKDFGVFCVAVSINAGGDIAGTYYDSTGAQGFVRSPKGIRITITVPGAAGTFPSSNNDSDAVTGFYVDSSGVQHGFLWE